MRKVGKKNVFKWKAFCEKSLGFPLIEKKNYTYQSHKSTSALLRKKNLENGPQLAISMFIGETLN